MSFGKCVELSRLSGLPVSPAELRKIDRWKEKTDEALVRIIKRRKKPRIDKGRR